MLPSKREVGQTFPHHLLRPEEKISGTKYFTCGQLEHFQQEGPHKECTWVKVLKRPQELSQELSPGLDYFTQLVVMNGKEVDALVDRECGTTLIYMALGLCLKYLLPYRLLLVHMCLFLIRMAVVSLGPDPEIGPKHSSIGPCIGEGPKAPKASSGTISS